MTIDISQGIHRHRLLIWSLTPVLLLLAVISAGEIAGWPFLRGPLQTAATDAAKVPVQLEGRFRTRLVWRPQVQIEHLQVGAASGVEGVTEKQAPHLLDARNVDLRWSWLDVWRWYRGAPLSLRRLHASDLDARLLRDRAGHATWQIGVPATPPAKTEEATGSLPRVGSLQVGNGKIVFDDKLLDTDLTVDIQGGEGEQAAKSGYRASIEGRWQKLPLDLKITSGGVLPLLADAEAGGQGKAEKVDFSIKGTAGAAKIAFEGSAGAVLGAQNLDGSLAFSGPSLARVGKPLGLTLPSTPPFALQGQLARKEGVWHLRADTATIGSSRLAGEFHFDPSPKPPKLTGKLSGSRLALADLGPAVGAETSSSASAPVAKTAGNGRVLPDKRFDLPSLRAMDADVTVAIDVLDFGSRQIAPLKQLKSHLVLADSVLKLGDLSAVVAGGDFSGSTQLDAREKEARWALDLKFSKVELAGWLRGLQSGDAALTAAPKEKNTAEVVAERKQASAGGEQPVKSYVTGVLNGSIKATGRGNSTGEILGRMDGNAKMLLRDGSISHLVTEGVGLDLAQALGVLIRGDRPLPLRCARFDLTAKDGVVQIDRAVLDNRDSTIRVAGGVNLRNERLGLKAQSRPKDFSPLSLNTPVTVGGTLASPAIGIEGGKLAAKVVGAAVLAAVVAPLAAVIPFVEFPKDSEKGDVCADAPAAAASSAAPR